MQLRQQKCRLPGAAERFVQQLRGRLGDNQLTGLYAGWTGNQTLAFARHGLLQEKWSLLRQRDG